MVSGSLLFSLEEVVEESLRELPAEVTGDHILCTCEMLCELVAVCRVYVDEFIIVSSIPIYSSNRGTAPIVYHQSSSIQNVSFDIMVLVFLFIV